MSNPFGQQGNFYKGNLHTHSTLSDGGRTPEEVCADYHARGYDFLSLTDHFLPNSFFRPDEPGFITVSDTTAFADEKFLTIPGAEVHGPAMANGEIWHLVAVGLPLDFEPLAEGESGLSVAKRAWDAGAWVSLAHPFWNTVSDADALQTTDFIHAVEVYNHASEMSVRRGWGMQTAEVLLQAGHRVQMNAADDAHIRQTGPLQWIDAFGGWVMVKATSLSEDAIIDALKAGAYYSSTGPEILDVTFTDNQIRIRTSEVQRVLVTGLGAVSTQAFGASLVDTTLDLPSTDKTPWVRVSVVDGHGEMAWTNPFWFDEIR